MPNNLRRLVIVAVMMLVQSNARAQGVFGNYSAGLGAGYGGYGGARSEWFGLAALTEANSKYHLTIQEARIKQQEAERERAKTSIVWEETKLQLIDLKSKQITAAREYRENVRKQQRLETLNWSRDNPPPHYIMSGLALNVIFEEIMNNKLDSGSVGPKIEVDPELLLHLNLNSGTGYNGAGLGILKANGMLIWPVLMRTPDMDSARRDMDRLVSQGVRMAQSDMLDLSTYLAIKKGVENLQKFVDGQISTLTPDEYLVANRFVSGLEKEVKIFNRTADAKKLFNGGFEAKGDNVGDVLEHMYRQGLKFAPAGEGDREYYQQFYNRLMQYDQAIRKDGVRN